MYLSNYLLNNGNSYQFFLNLSSGASERKSHVVFLEGCERSSMAEQRTGAFQNQYKFNDYGVKGFAKTFYEHTARSAELDEETGYYYYGARYYNPQISAWLSVDPIGVYNPVLEIEHYIDGQHNGGVFNNGNLNCGYTYQNPINYFDPNVKQTFWQRLYDFAAKMTMSDENAEQYDNHVNFVRERGGTGSDLDILQKARKIAGKFNRGGTFETIEPTLKKNGPIENDGDRGSDQGAYRHAVWSAVMSNLSNRGKAQLLANAHEGEDASDLDFKLLKLSCLSSGDADTYADELNNRLGRNIAGKLGKTDNKNLAISILTLFRDKGLFRFREDGGDDKEGKPTYEIYRSRINQKDYNTLINSFKSLDANGVDQRD